MNTQKRNKILLVLGATIGLFLLNNILLGAIVPRLPGGSATGITTMFVITLLSLKLKQFGVIPVVFFIYGLIGLPSHLIIDPLFILPEFRRMGFAGFDRFRNRFIAGICRNCYWLFDKQNRTERKTNRSFFPKENRSFQ